MQHEKISDDLDLIELISYFWGYKYTIFLFSLFFSLFSISISFSFETKYISSSLLVPSEKDSQSQISSSIGSLAAFAGVNLKNSEETNLSELALKSVYSLDFFERSLFSSEYFKNNLKEPLRSDIKDAYDYFIDNLAIDDKDKPFITMDYYSHTPSSAKNILNFTIDALNKNFLEKNKMEKQLSLEYLYLEVNKTNIPEVKDAISSLIKKNLGELSLSEIKDDFVFEILDSPRVEDKRAYPSRRLFAIIGFLSSFIIISIALLIFFFFDQKPILNLFPPKIKLEKK